jgi:diadenosine tetraphosphate (Ap4A) HIT family hydrolase
LLICPRNHIASLQDASVEDAAMLGRLQLVATKLAGERNLQAGFRTVINTGEHGGQSVLHLHLHLLGGRSMRWPPGLFARREGRAAPNQNGLFMMERIQRRICVRRATADSSPAWEGGGFGMTHFDGEVWRSRGVEEQGSCHV